MPERDSERGELHIGVRAENRASEYGRGQRGGRAGDRHGRTREVVRDGGLEGRGRESGGCAGEVPDEVDVSAV